MLHINEIARLCHEVNRAYCRALGDNSQPSWDDAPDWQRASCIDGVRKHLDDPTLTPEESHANWMAHKTAEGWTYGTNKDAELKTHPAMVPYNRLPKAQRAKDYLFAAVVRTAAGLEYNPQRESAVAGHAAGAAEA